MKYTSIILVMLLFLTGCTKMTQDFNVDISNKINEVATEKSSSPYYNHKYYSYNIESILVESVLIKQAMYSLITELSL